MSAVHNNISRSLLSGRGTAVIADFLYNNGDQSSDFSNAGGLSVADAGRLGRNGTERAVLRLMLVRARTVDLLPYPQCVR